MAAGGKDDQLEAIDDLFTRLRIADFRFVIADWKP